jgi:RNA polymerase sigma-70 factor (ECF subfamily)
VDDAAKYRWLATHILPHESDVRGWLVRHVRTLSRADADDLIQEAYARLTYSPAARRHACVHARLRRDR